MSPLVAVTATLVPEAGPHRRPEVALYANYLSVLESFELSPVLVTPAHSPRSLRALLSHCSGFVLTGGEDVDPARYGEAPVPELGTVSPARDAMELSALELALEQRIPVLGICRGCQLLNVAFGGTLYQDLDTQRPGEVRHRQTEPWGRRTHRARARPGTRLASMLGSGELLINSFHHQGIKEVAAGLEVAAVADDGLIEAIEAPGRWVVGVQWHPERHEATAPASDPDRLLFAAFRQAVAAGVA